jgi:squalene-hopene/tetraprenyl-beta-curcumene cyclase
MRRSPVETTLNNLRARFLSARVGDHWEGRLSSSALASATASIALSLGGRDELANRGVAWLMEAQNDDGGWGDTALSLSNISTTALGWAALTVGPAADAQNHVDRAAAYMERHAGGLDPESLTQAIKRRYGKDHTFSVPILTVLAIAGLLGEHGWSRVPQLPFELACFPQRWYNLLQLPVVSYALPALIGIGQARHAKNPTKNPVSRIFRDGVRQATLQKLLKIQPSNGGFLEATPLTSFVTMSLIVAGQADHPVACKGLDFLERSVRADGSWPIDTNLSTWLTTLGVNALSAGPGPTLNVQQRAATSAWLLSQQFREEHLYTGAAPGGWAWTNLPGGVPDADDTAGALLAVRALTDPTPDILEAARLGVLWLVNLQNRDGGIPTFCRGWGALSFDRSSPDLTAHALRAWQRWRLLLPPAESRRVADATGRALRYLESVQRSDGSWAPLWFGNQHAPDDVNLTYGTARVLLALAELAADAAPLAEQAAELWLLNAQGTDGGWGGAPGLPSSIEETAVAVSALAFRGRRRNIAASDDPARAIMRGIDWLVSATEQGFRTEPSPIGFYFAKLWYFEDLYPLVFSLEALRHVAALDLQKAPNPVAY